MSARNRSVPWFRTPGARYELEVAQYEFPRRRERALFNGTMKMMPLEVRFYNGLWCDRCYLVKDDVCERQGVTVHGVIRLRAMLCDECAS